VGCDDLVGEIGFVSIGRAQGDDGCDDGMVAFDAGFRCTDDGRWQVVMGVVRMCRAMSGGMLGML